MYIKCAKFHVSVYPLAGDMGKKPIFGLGIFRGPSCLWRHCFAASVELDSRPIPTVLVPFDNGNFIPVLCVPWTLYGHQTFSTCTPRDRLLYYVGLSPNLFPVWPLGGAKCFFSTLNISAAPFFLPRCHFSSDAIYQPMANDRYNAEC